ncbi:MFS transporter [Saccharothrix australiensis]|uniref:Putative MFS family arabinose efflux permease n=1 Tax=Saccharothrix australiensis TaxID=2072 RepID=A0A495VZZ6_9PSEU|nr:MFS transporter [Saccharothrix australiensis]RKT54714.1 putative MFS family arabinose efflux permease [Saccharothrix australiensis]
MTTTRTAGIVGAFTVSSVGDWIYRLAFPILVFQLTGSAVSTAFAYVVEFIPYVLVGLLAGAVADRVRRRLLMISCDLVSALLAGLLAVLASLPGTPLWLLYAVALVLASVRPFYFPAFQGYLTTTVPEDRLVRVNSTTQTLDSGLAMLGPFAGVAAVAWLGAAQATALNALSFALSALIMSRCPADPAPTGAPAVHLVASVADGLRQLVRLRVIWWGTVLLTLSNLAAFMIEGNLVYLGLEVNGLDSLALSLVFAGQGLGAVLGAVLCPRLVDRFRTGHLLVAGLGLSVVAALAAALHPSWAVVVVAWGVEGVGTSLVVVPWFTARQKIVPTEVMGRVVSVSRALSYLTIPLGALLGGWLLAARGATALFGWTAAVAALVALAAAVGPLSRIDRDVEDARRAKAVG